MTQPITYNGVDHTAAMQANLISQFQGLPNIGFWITALGAQLNDIDQAIGQLLTMLPLQGAAGAQLDALGGLLGQARDGLNDPTYQALLQAKIVQLRSQGSVENLIQILLSLAGAVSVQAIESQPAAISILVTGEVTPALTNSDIVTAVYQAKPAGVLLTLNAAVQFPAFQFDVPDSAESAGFDNGHIAGPYA